MIGIRILFCLFLVNVGGANGVGEEADNSNGKKNDLLFGEMWRKAFEANRHNGKEREEKEEMAKTKVKEEQREEEENKLWKKVKREPIDDQLKMEEEEEEKRDGKKWKKTIKKEPKIEENELDKSVGKSKSKENDQQQQDDNSTSDKNDMDQTVDFVTFVTQTAEFESESNKLTDEAKRKIIKAYDEKREELKMRREFNIKTRAKIEQRIAKELGTYRGKIYKWKRELIQKRKPESEEEKRAITEKFDKMLNEYKSENGNRAKFEHKIAKELGTFRNQIYEWKRELLNGEKKQGIEEKWEIIENFDKMRKECKTKGYTNEMRVKIEHEIAKKLGTYRDKIYEWKNELNTKKEAISEERKKEIIEKFDKLRNECKKKREFKRENRIKIEQKIAKELGTYRHNIYEWKNELNGKNECIIKKKTKLQVEREERKRKIVEKFDKMRNEYKMKNNNTKNYGKIEQKIANQLGTSRTSIYRWKKALTPSRVIYTMEQKRAIIEEFDKLCEEFSNKFNRKTTKKIEEKIAKKFHVCRNSIYLWKSMQRNDD